MARKPTRNRAKRTGRGGGAVFIVVGLAVLALMLFATPVFVAFSVGMIPAFVAVIVDREPARNATIAVSATNLAGVVPFVLDLVADHASMTQAIAMVTDMFVLVTMYGAAAIGWLLVLGLPKLAAVYIGVTTRAHIESMRRDQQRLVEEWGPEVAEG